MKKSLKLYTLLGKGPLANSYIAKLFLVVFVGTHLPILALIVYVVVQQPESLSWPLALAIILVATLAGTVWAFVALHALLRPVYHAAQTLRQFRLGKDTDALPLGHPDQLGQMLTDLHQTLERTRNLMGQFAHEAVTDPLTGVLNRRGAETRIDQSQTSVPCVIVLMDLDDLKEINDQHGHPLGDEALIRVTRRINKELLEQGEWLARWGGDEFLLRMNLPVQTALQRLHAFQGRLAEDGLVVSGESIGLSLSAGMVTLETADAFETAVHDADRALYETKANNKGSASVYSSSGV